MKDPSIRFIHSSHPIASSAAPPCRPRRAHMMTARVDIPTADYSRLRVLLHYSPTLLGATTVMTAAPALSVPVVV